jgi:hypothetical protein
MENEMQVALEALGFSNVQVARDDVWRVSVTSPDGKVTRVVGPLETLPAMMVSATFARAEPIKYRDALRPISKLPRPLKTLPEIQAEAARRRDIVAALPTLPSHATLRAMFGVGASTATSLRYVWQARQRQAVRAAREAAAKT